MVALAGKQNGQSWALAPSLIALVHEVDERWPARSKIADGSIGDADHASRASDHNPDGPFVHAVDLTHDPDHGMPGPLLVSLLLHDDRVAYLIHAGRVWRSYDKPGIPAWTPARYTGESPHTHHVHVSILHTDKARQDTGLWLREDDMTPDQAKRLERLEEKVDRLLKAMGSLFHDDELTGPLKQVRKDVTAIKSKVGA